MLREVKQRAGLDLTIPLLSDSEHKVISRYGLLNPGTVPGPKTRKFSTPATFILDGKGIVRWRVVEENWKMRPSNEMILAALERVRSGKDASDLVMQTGGPEGKTTAAVRALPAKLAKTSGMVLIPAGAFTMGAGEAPEPGRTLRDTAPAHQVVLDSYYIDQHEVTNRDYRAFLQEIQRTHDHSRCDSAEPRDKDHTPQFWNDNRYNQDDLPVAGVDWFDAYAYCAWAGKQLPTEAEWEKAARGGKPLPPEPENPLDAELLYNVKGEADETGARHRDLGKPLPEHQHHPKPPGSYPPNGYRLYDMRGNVEEWLFDWYAPDYYQHSPERNPTGPATGLVKSVRGGSWHHHVGAADRRYTREPSQHDVALGFRCVRPASR
jgi:formylglycine-generating enzyme required for sulfatase activity